MSQLVLEKGQRLDLTKTAPGATKFYVGLHWPENPFDGAKFDCDVTAFALANGKMPDERHMVFYNSLFKTADDKPATPCLGLIHSGDNQTGAAEGDDEFLYFDTSKIAANINEISIVVTLHDAEARKQNFGQLRDVGLVIKIEGQTDVLASFDLSDDFSTETAVQIGSLTRKNDGWRFEAIAAGYKRGLGDFIKAYS